MKILVEFNGGSMKRRREITRVGKEGENFQTCYHLSASGAIIYDLIDLIWTRWSLLYIWRKKTQKSTGGGWGDKRHSTRPPTTPSPGNPPTRLYLLLLRVPVCVKRVQRAGPLENAQLSRCGSIIDTLLKLFGGHLNWIKNLLLENKKKTPPFPFSLQLSSSGFRLAGRIF